MDQGCRGYFRPGFVPRPLIHPLFRRRVDEWAALINTDGMDEALKLIGRELKKLLGDSEQNFRLRRKQHPRARSELKLPAVKGKVRKRPATSSSCSRIPLLITTSPSESSGENKSTHNCLTVSRPSSNGTHYDASPHILENNSADVNGQTSRGSSKNGNAHAHHRPHHRSQNEKRGKEKIVETELGKVRVRYGDDKSNHDGKMHAKSADEGKNKGSVQKRNTINASRDPKSGRITVDVFSCGPTPEDSGANVKLHIKNQCECSPRKPIRRNLERSKHGRDTRKVVFIDELSKSSGDRVRYLKGARMSDRRTKIPRQKIRVNSGCTCGCENIKCTPRPKSTPTGPSGSRASGRWSTSWYEPIIPRCAYEQEIERITGCSSDPFSADSEQDLLDTIDDLISEIENCRTEDEFSRRKSSTERFSIPSEIKKSLKAVENPELIDCLSKRQLERQIRREAAVVHDSLKTETLTPQANSPSIGRNNTLVCNPNASSPQLVSTNVSSAQPQADFASTAINNGPTVVLYPVPQLVTVPQPVSVQPSVLCDNWCQPQQPSPNIQVINTHHIVPPGQMISLHSACSTPQVYNTCLIPTTAPPLFHSTAVLPNANCPLCYSPF